MDTAKKSGHLWNLTTHRSHTNTPEIHARYIHHYKLLHKTHTQKPPGKALGPYAITNETIKYLPKEMYKIIYTLFLIMAKHNYIFT
jgi:hypothetical protein